MNLNEMIAKIKEQEIPALRNAQLLDIFEGNLYEHVASSLAQELSAESFKVAKSRIPPINILRRIVKKLSKVYSDEPRRLVPQESDQPTIDAIAEQSQINSTMSDAEDLLNLCRSFALEPYLDAGEWRIRVLAPSEFTVLSDDPQNSKKMTHFIKYMGKKTKISGRGDQYSANVYWIYTNDTFMVVDSDGVIETMEANPYGVIPFVYVSGSSFSLVPKPDTDSYDMTILVPKLLSDLNYATQFQSHSIMYSIDAEIQRASGAPDTMWNLVSRDGEGKKPEVGVLSPSVDTEKVIALITFTVSQWLESRGIKPGNVGQQQGTNFSSGISKIIDEADTTQVVDENRIILTQAEKKLWELVAIMQNTLIGTGLLIEDRGITEPVNISIAFPVSTPLPDPAERRAELKFKLDNGLISRQRALKEANPDLTDEELALLAAEIDGDMAKQDAREKALAPTNTNI